MNAELIAVGTELLLGDTINTDAAAVARLLSELGINHRLYACCSRCLFLCISPCREVLAVIVLKFHLKCNSGPHTEISVKEPLHRFRVPGKYHNDILSVVFHFPKQCRNSDLALQRICFINE